MVQTSRSKAESLSLFVFFIEINTALQTTQQVGKILTKLTLNISKICVFIDIKYQEGRDQVGTAG